MTSPAERTKRPVRISEQTARDTENRRYFESGWNAALTEVIAAAKHDGDEMAVWWANQHLIDTSMRKAEIR